MEIAAISNGLASLALLACPVGMGLMMWMMGRGMKQDDASTRNRPPAPPTADVAAEPASIEVLREEQRRLGEEIDRLEGRSADGTAAGGGR